jgi:general secretion pathway protein E/type IV pilus assembly protein PilB
MRLGDRLVHEGYVTKDELRIALTEQRRTGKKLGEVLVELGFMDEDTAREVVGDVVGYSSISLKGVVPDPKALSLISETFARSNLVLPISLIGNELKVAMTNPDDILLLDKIRRHIKSSSIRIRPVLAVEKEIQQAIDRYYGYELSIDGILSELETGEIDLRTVATENEYSQPIVRLVDGLLTDAVKRGASDVHFEPEEKFFRIRYRIDGVLQQIRLFHKFIWPGIVVRLKVMSQLDLTDQRRPQDGRMDLIVHGRQINFRVSSLPGTHGENFVLRILDKDKGIVPLDKLGLDPDSYKELRIMMARPTGILLVTGPTGSGKTTTLYSMMNELNNMSVNIMTLEDPVEYPMQLIRQTAVNEEAGLTFGTGIRALLRQDPDIILVGEIRDSETAEMALRAAMTGHQVFSTLHTNSAVGAIPRLLDIGVSKSIMSGNIIGVVAQRLARKLCTVCKQPYEASEVEKKLLGVPVDKPLTLYKPVGCEACGGSGYKGRLAILETLRFTSEIDELILHGASQKEILDVALKQGFRTMVHSALRWVQKGETTLDEVSRVVDLTELVK